MTVYELAEEEGDSRTLGSRQERGLIGGTFGLELRRIRFAGRRSSSLLVPESESESESESVKYRLLILRAISAWRASMSRCEKGIDAILTLLPNDVRPLIADTCNFGMIFFHTIRYLQILVNF